MQFLAKAIKFGMSIYTALLAVVLMSSSVFAEPILFRGKHVYLVPENMADKMTEFTGKGDWKPFFDLTRQIDTDGDGKADFIAIGLGTTAGYGAQIRYRLIYEGSGSEPRLGPWYWGVITDDTGVKVFEEFNP